MCVSRTKKEGSGSRANSFSARGPGPLPIRISFPKEAEEKAFEDAELPLHFRILQAKSAKLLGGWSLCSRICLQEGVKRRQSENHFVPAG